ncbi:MAG: TIGR02453 family protein [Acidobacteriota bacterium]
MSSTSAYFTPALFTFLRQLKKHNARDWFLANRDRYVADVEAPMLRFLTDAAPHLRRISPAIVVDARRTGGSMYRIYRDTRFSADKSPYKTHVAAHFAHERKKTVPSVTGFYFHLEPGDCMGGGGIYHPDSPTLARIRLAIVENPKAWAAVRKTVTTIEGERLTRAPVGFDPAHKYIDDLRLKDFYAVTSFTPDQVCGGDFMARYVASCRDAAPLVGFVTSALGWRW